MKRRKAFLPSLYEKSITNVRLCILTAFTFDKLSLFNKHQFEALLTDI